MTADYCPTCHSIIDKGRPSSRLGLVLDGCILTHETRTIRMTRCEATILKPIIERQRISKEALCLHVSEDSDDAVRLLNVYLVRIRRKLKALAPVILIRNIHGWGYELTLG